MLGRSNPNLRGLVLQRGLYGFHVPLKKCEPDHTTTGKLTSTSAPHETNAIDIWKALAALITTQGDLK
jgi:hypothetical protein